MPFRSKVADGQIERLVFSVGPGGQTFAGHKVLETAEVLAKGVVAFLKRDVTGRRQIGVKERMVKAEESVEGMIASVGWNSMDGAMFTGAIRKSCVQNEDTIDKSRHESLLAAEGDGKHQPPSAVNHILLRRLVGWAPDAPLKASGAEKFVPMNKRIAATGIEFDKVGFADCQSKPINTADWTSPLGSREMRKTATRHTRETAQMTMGVRTNGTMSTQERGDAQRRDWFGCSVCRR